MMTYQNNTYDSSSPVSFTSAGLQGNSIYSIYIGGDNSLINVCNCTISDYRVYVNNILWNITDFTSEDFMMAVAGEISKNIDYSMKCGLIVTK